MAAKNATTVYYVAFLDAIIIVFVKKNIECWKGLFLKQNDQFLCLRVFLHSSCIAKNFLMLQERPAYDNALIQHLLIHELDLSY